MTICCSEDRGIAVSIFVQTTPHTATAHKYLDFVVSTSRWFRILPNSIDLIESMCWVSSEYTNTDASRR